MDDLTTYVERLGISQEQPGQIHAQNVNGLGSIYMFDIKPGQKIYRYDVEVVKMFNNTEKSLTTGGTDDGQKGRFRSACMDSVKIFYDRTNGFGGAGHVLYVYDCRKNLFTNAAINIQQKSIEFASSDLPLPSKDIMRDARIRVEIQPCQTAQNVIDISDVSSSLQTSASVPADHTLRMFLEMLTSQPFLNARTHTVVGAGKMFDNHPARHLENGIVLHKGLAKGVKIIENNGKPVPALVADVKTCAFYEPITLDQLYEQMMGDPRNRNDPKFWCKFVSFLRGVRLVLTYDASRTFVFGNITKRNIGEVVLNFDGRDLSLVEYFKGKNITLTNIDVPGIRPEGSNREAIYPLQCCKILPFQRITIDKMSENISRELLNANTTAPQVRYDAIEQGVRQIGDQKGTCGKFLRDFGVILVGVKNQIEIGIRNPPLIKFGDRDVHPKNGRFDERFYNYYCCSNILKSFVVGHPRKVNRDEVEKFIRDLTNMAQKKGVRLPKPEFVQVELDNLEMKISELSQQRKQFFMLIDPKYVKSHGVLKVCEKKFSVITQHVTIEMARKAGGASVTNVLNKLHMKIAFQNGLNYMPKMEPVALKKFDLSSGKVLVIGLDSSNAPRATPYERYVLRKEQIDADSTEPTVIGICANYVQESYSFCGTYFFQPAKQDAILPSKLKENVMWVLNKAKKNRPNGSGPNLIFIIRDGVSEGQIPNAVKNEFCAIREACLQFEPGYIPKFVFCVVDKSHNKRFFSGQKGNLQNLTPSSVVDTKIVRPDMHEFYLQSHYPLKGTANVPQYVFPINEIRANNDELQAFINCLCHNWQIVNLAPSLPSPVLQAHELAKRGRNNYQELKRTDKVPKLPNAQVDYERLNTMLSYSNHKFSDTRFNA